MMLPALGGNCVRGRLPVVQVVEACDEIVVFIWKIAVGVLFYPLVSVEQQEKANSNHQFIIFEPSFSTERHTRVSRPCDEVLGGVEIPRDFFLLCRSQQTSSILIAGNVFQTLGAEGALRPCKRLGRFSRHSALGRWCRERIVAPRRLLSTHCSKITSRAICIYLLCIYRPLTS